MSREDAIRALSRKISKCCEGKPGDIIGAALATVVGDLCMQFSDGDEKVAIGGVDALLGDARLFVQMRHAHQGTAQ